MGFFVQPEFLKERIRSTYANVLGDNTIYDCIYFSDSTEYDSTSGGYEEVINVKLRKVIDHGSKFQVCFYMKNDNDGGTVYAQILKNGVDLAEFNTDQPGWTEKTVNLTAQVWFYYDSVSFEIKKGTSAKVYFGGVMIFGHNQIFW